MGLDFWEEGGGGGESSRVESERVYYCRLLLSAPKRVFSKHE